jgi:hypothetical protein
MGTLASGNERRRALRAPVHGTVVLHRRRGAVRGRIENLSLGGVLVRSRDRSVDVPGEVDVELRLRGGAVVVTGRVIRIEIDGEELAIAVRFDPVPPESEDAIEDEVVGAVAAGKSRPVLIVDGVEERRRGLAAALRDHKMTPVVPRTPLELMDLLSCHERRVDVCLLSPQFAGMPAMEIASAIRDAFPWVRVIVADDDSDANSAAKTAQAAWDDLDSAW